MNNQGLGHEGARHLTDALLKGIKESGGKGLKLTYFSAGRNRLENVGACLLAKVFSQIQTLEEVSNNFNVFTLSEFSSIFTKMALEFTAPMVSPHLLPPLHRILICVC